MNKTELFPAASDYFDRMDGDDKSAVVQLFTPQAVVVDDGHTYRGRAEISDWLTGPASEFTTTSTWLSVDQNDDTAAVVIQLAGDFPGGLVDLQYLFAQDPSGRIGALTIAPVGAAV
jgi:ketosteroid isomerase-like protein